VAGEGFTEASYNRSEGLGVASVKMFADGMFSSVEGQPCRVDGTISLHQFGDHVLKLRQPKVSRKLLHTPSAPPCKWQRLTRWSAWTAEQASSALFRTLSLRTRNSSALMADRVVLSVWSSFSSIVSDIGLRLM
jgi:hypothetical protein